jgi:hypothetical protein
MFINLSNLTGLLLTMCFLNVQRLHAQSRPQPVLDYANQIYYYDTVGNAVLKLETGLFKNNGAKNHLFSVTNSVYLDGKASPIRINISRPSFLLRLLNKDIDPMTYLGFCTLTVNRTARARLSPLHSLLKSGVVILSTTRRSRPGPSRRWPMM